MPIASCPMTGDNQKGLAPSSLYSPSRNLYTLIKLLESSLLQSQISHRRDSSGPSLSSWPFAGHWNLSNWILSGWVSASIHWCMELFLPRCMTLHLPLLNFVIFLSSHFSSLLRYIWKPPWPLGDLSTLSSFVSGANLLMVHSAISSKSLRKM